MKVLKITTSVLLLGMSLFAHAASFCVSNSTMLETVLDIAESNGQSDEIKIVSGNYIPLNDWGFRFYLGENHGLDISGGWSSGCASQSLNPLDTVLEGDNSKQVISFYTDQSSPDITTSISISILSIMNGFYHEHGTTVINTSGLGFRLNVHHLGSVVIDRLFFMGNRSNNPSALRATGEKFTVKNSVFFNNESDFGTISASVNRFYFINNTVVNNTYYTQFNGGASESGLWVSQYSEQVFIANNLLWENYGDDIIAGTTGTNNPGYYLYHNDFQSKSGTFDFESDNISEDPQLGFLNFTPAHSSPLVDSGHHNPPLIPFPPPFQLNWSFGTSDFLSASRVVNNRVDIGAVEAPEEVPIFVNGFE